MRYPTKQIEAVVELRARGTSARAIAERLGIPRGTVEEWLYRRRPAGADGSARCSACGAQAHEFDQLPAKYVYLLGLYLGDGSIATHARDVFKLRITLDARYPVIVAEAVSAIEETQPRNKVNKWRAPRGYVEVYSYSKSWPCLFPQHGFGRKHLRTIALSQWQERLVQGAPQQLLRGLIHSDGCRFMNTGRASLLPRYGFSNLSADIRNIFIWACDLLSLHWTTSGRTVYVSRKADVVKMDQFIGPKR